MRKTASVLAVAVACTVAAPAAEAASKAKTYKPPFRTGPSAVNSTSGAYRDNASGQMGMFYVCTSGKPAFASFRVLHKVSSKISSITLTFDGGVDPSSMIFLELWTPTDKRLGSAAIKGPSGAVGGTLTMKPRITPKKNSGVFIEFGLRGTSCPAASLSGARFNSVSVRG